MTNWADKKAREIVHARVCRREGDACSVDALQALISLTIRQAVTAERAENKRLKSLLSKQIDFTDAAEWEAQRLREENKIFRTAHEQLQKVLDRKNHHGRE